MKTNTPSLNKCTLLFQNTTGNCDTPLQAVIYKRPMMHLSLRGVVQKAKQVNKCSSSVRGTDNESIIGVSDCTRGDKECSVCGAGCARVHVHCCSEIVRDSACLHVIATARH